MARFLSPLCLLALLTCLAAPSTADPFETFTGYSMLELLIPGNLEDVLSQFTLHHISRILQIVNLLDFNPKYAIELMPFEGGLEPNDALDAATPLATDVVGGKIGEFKGASSFAVRNNFLYAGIQGGDIVKMDLASKTQWESVFQLGSDCDHAFQAGQCSRAMDLAFISDSQLVVCDAFSGLLKIDLQAGTSEVLSPESIDDVPVTNLYAVTVAQDGTIYYTSSNPNYAYYQQIGSLVDPEGKGRLLKYDPSTRETTVLADNLMYATGLALSEGENYLLVAEGGKGKIWKYYLDGSQAGFMRYLGSVPGVAGQIKPNGQGGFLIGVTRPLLSKQFTVLNDVIFPNKSIRSVVLLIYDIIIQNTQAIAMAADAISPNAEPSLLDQAVAASSTAGELSVSLQQMSAASVSALLQGSIQKINDALSAVTLSADLLPQNSTTLQAVDFLLANTDSLDDVLKTLSVMADQQLLPGIDCDLVGLGVDMAADKVEAWAMDDPARAMQYQMIMAAADGFLANTTSVDEVLSGVNAMIAQAVGSTVENLAAKILAGDSTLLDPNGASAAAASAWINLDETVASSSTFMELVAKNLDKLDYMVANPGWSVYPQQTYGLLTEMNSDGEITDSWHSQTGQVTQVTCGLANDGQIYAATEDLAYELV